MTQVHTPEMETIKARQQQTWATGDYDMIGVHLLITSEALAEAVPLRPGWKVLDVATGSGNTALAAARRYCEVTGVDFVPALLERGRERAKAERLAVDFREGDAESPPFPDSTFDAVLSTFGVMFAPNQEQAAAEMLRVCRPGGKIGLANWTPDGWAGEFFKTVGRHAPPPAGLKPPPLWGTESRLRELFGGQISSLETNRRAWVQRYHSPQHWLQAFRTYFGPVARAFAAVGPAGEEALARDLIAVLQQFNQSGDETAIVNADYLEVVATKRG